MAYPPNPSANFGFIGSMQLQSLMGGVNFNYLRFTSSDLKMKQEAEVMSSTSANFDKAVYIMKNKEVEGGIQFPLIIEEMQGGVVQALWQQTVVRQNNGRLYPFDIILKYYKGHTYAYTTCLINGFEINVNQSDIVNCNINVIGLNKTGSSLRENIYENRNSRAITWNNVQVTAGKNALTIIPSIGGPTIISDIAFSIPTESIRSFKLNIANNVERLYTFGHNLYPSDLIARQRDITGTLTMLNINDGASAQALVNDSLPLANGFVQFIINDPCIKWGVNLPNILFHIEEVGMSTNIIESVVNFKCILGNLTANNMQNTFEIAVI